MDDTRSSKNWLDEIERNTEDTMVYSKIDYSTIENNFENKQHPTYHDFALMSFLLESSNKIGKQYVFEIPSYADLVSKMYLCFELPKLIPHKTSTWSCWINCIGFFIIDKIQVCVNNNVKEEISGYTLYNEYITKVNECHAQLYEKNIGLFHTDIELRQNATQKSYYKIPLHLFFSKSYFNAFPINRGDVLEIKIDLVEKDKRYISSNMIAPEDYRDIFPKLDIEYVYLSSTEESFIKNENLVYIIETKNDVNIPIYNKNVKSDISIIIQNLITNYNKVSDLYTNIHKRIFNNIHDYVEYTLLNYPEYVEFTNYFINNIIIDLPITHIDIPNSDILTWININNSYNIFTSSQSQNFHYSYIASYNCEIQNKLSPNMYNIFLQNGFNSMLYYGIDHSETKYIDEQNEFLNTSIAYSDKNDFEIKLQNFLNAENTLLIDEIVSFEKQKESIETTWLNKNSNNYQNGNIFSIQENINLLTNVNTNLSSIVTNYSELKQTLENNEQLPLVEYVNTYLNDLKLFFKRKYDDYKKSGYFESDLNIFSFNNVYISSNSVITYPPGNYYITDFPFYFQNPNGNIFISQIDNYPPAGLPPENNGYVNTKISPIERVLMNNNFKYNSIFIHYYIDNIEDLVYPIQEYIEHIDKDNLINLYDYSKSIEIIEGLNNILNVQESNTSAVEFANIQSNIHKSISDVLKDVISEQQNDIINNQIKKQIDSNLTSIEIGTQFIYSITDDVSIIPNCFSDYYNDTIYTLLQYKEKGYNSVTIFDNVESFVPIIKLLEEAYEDFDVLCSQLSEILQLFDGNDENTDVKSYSIIRNLIQSQKEEFRVYLLKNQFEIHNINFESSYVTFNSQRLFFEYHIEKMWLNQFQLIANTLSKDVANKHIDRYLEHIRGQKYNVQSYIHNISNLNLIQVYSSLLDIDYQNIKYSMSEYSLLSLMNKMSKNRQNIIYLDTLVYDLKSFSNKFLETVTYPIKIENMNISNKVYSNLLNDIDNEISKNNNAITYNNVVINQIQQIEQSINEVEDELNQLQNVQNVLDDLEYENYNLNDYQINTIPEALSNRVIEVINENSSIYFDKYNTYLLNQEENNNNKKINETRNDIFENISSFQQLLSSEFSLTFNFDLIRRFPVKAIWFSIHKYEKYKTKNYFSKIEHDNVTVERVVISVNEEIETTILTHDDMKFLKPFFYSNKNHTYDIYCIPFCINTDSLLPSGAFHPLKKDNDLKISIIIKAKTYENIVINMNVSQWEILNLEKKI